MSMSHAHHELLSSGKPEDLAYANILAAIIETRGDIPLPEAADSVTAAQGERSITAAVPPEVLELWSPERDLMEGEVSELVAAEENSSNLQARFRVVALPYENLCKELTPAPQMPRIRFRGPKELGKEGVTNWSYEAVGRDTTINYQFKLGYRQKGVANNPAFLKMVMASQHDPAPPVGNEVTSPVVKLSFKDEELSGASLSWHQATPRVLRKLMEATALGKLLEDAYIFDNDNQDFSKLVLTLAPTPGLVLQQKFGGHLIAPIRRVTSQSAFVYQPGEDIFTRQSTDVDLDRKLAIDKRQSMSPAEFADLLYGILRLIPTTDQPKFS